MNVKRVQECEDTRNEQKNPPHISHTLTFFLHIHQFFNILIF